MTIAPGRNVFRDESQWEIGISSKDNNNEKKWSNNTDSSKRNNKNIFKCIRNLSAQLQSQWFVDIFIIYLTLKTFLSSQVGSHSVPIQFLFPCLCTLVECGRSETETCCSNLSFGFSDRAKNGVPVRVTATLTGDTARQYWLCSEITGYIQIAFYRFERSHSEMCMGIRANFWMCLMNPYKQWISL